MNLNDIIAKWTHIAEEKPSDNMVYHPWTVRAMLKELEELCVEAVTGPSVSIEFSDDLGTWTRVPATARYLRLYLRIPADSQSQAPTHQDTQGTKSTIGQSPSMDFGVAPTAALLDRSNAEMMSLKAEVDSLKAENEKLAKFKTYVHNRLNLAEVPADPEPYENARHGCRIEGRLNWLFNQRAMYKAAQDRLKAENESLKKERVSTETYAYDRGYSEAEQRSRLRLIALSNIKSLVVAERNTLSYPASTRESLNRLLLNVETESEKAEA